MIAHFYILAESFQNNSNLSDSEIEEKVKRLSEDVKLIHKYKETNKLYTNYGEIYPQLFYSHYTVENFICSPQILKQNGIDGWYKFRRHFLGEYPKDTDYFMNECIKYFPKLYFHEQNRKTIKAIFDDCPKKIIYHLSALNDKFRDCVKNGLNRTQILEQFSIYANLDETASPEGDVDRKKDFTFLFINDSGVNEKVCCEPHLKLCYSDTDNSYSNNRRIYFHEGKSNIQNGCILIGHIGKHL